MKFLCPQCKAKYRIADEKLAQRSSSRMKCRKCGHVIDIHSATVPESIRPGGAAPHDEEGDEEEPPTEIPRAGAKPVAPPRRTGQAPVKRAPVTSGRGGPVAPRRGGGGAAVAEQSTIVLDDELPTDVPRKSSESLLSSPPEPAPARNDFEEEAPTRIHDGGALAAAFSLTAGPAATPASASVDEWYVGIDGTPTGPISIATMRETASTGKITLESLVWRDGFEEWKPLREFPELAALVAEANQTALATEALKTIPAPSPLEEQQKNASSSLESELSSILPGKAKRSTSHPMAWVAMVVALALGVTIGAVLLSKTETKELVKYVEVPASAKVAVAPAPVGGDTVIEEAQVQGGGTKRAGGPAPKAGDPPPAPPKGGLAGLNGLNGLNGLGPATAGGSDVAGQGSAPGGQLDGNAIQRVVANFSPSVRRGCWDSALAARGPDAPSSARVTTSISISPSGGVDNVTTSGDPKGYPGLSRCIESKVRGWRFPRSSGSTTANVPFVFAAQ